MAVRDRDWQRAGLLCCWVMIVTGRNSFIVFDSKPVIITSVKRWEQSVPEFEKYHWLKMKALLTGLTWSSHWPFGKKAATNQS